MIRLVPAATSAVLGLMLALAALAGPTVLAAALLVVVVALAAGWPTLLGLPTQRGSTSVLALCGTAAVVVVFLADDGDESHRLGWLAPVLALSIVATFTHQLLRRDMRPRLVESVTGVVSGVVVVELVAGWLAAAVVDLEVVLAGVATLVPAALALALPWPQRVTGAVSLAAGVVFGALASVFLHGIATVPAVALGGLVAVVLVSFDRLFTVLPSITSRQSGVAVGAAGVCCAGAITYLVSIIVG